MPEKVLRAVAYPPQLFWAPQVPAGVNMALHAFLMIYGWMIFKMSPLIFIASFFATHAAIASLGQREPHMTTLIQAWMFTIQKRTRNLVRPKNNRIRKFSP
ncbi:MAG: hypothetical protein ACK5XX_07885 [Holosporales bacterium]|jgi:hypothetical protein